jgi:ABC-type phosphate transport system ATPase subunit
VSLERRMMHYHVPGVSIAVIAGGRIEWARAYGVAEAGGTSAADTTTLFQGASISKVVTTTAALRLVERQRLALARALARDPHVLLLDEPTASLDPAATQAIEDLVRDVSARGVKIVMTTHDLGEASRVAGDVVLMHRGAVIESGPATAVLEHPATEEARRFIAGQLLV